ncbi:MAG: hypothetical protein L3K52_12850 [Candidatus Thiothrix sulfatifontis]|nr:MAG: hypothetical protein L3K52_12850 [Candidatus Thiothrix sulfatifontis]
MSLLIVADTGPLVILAKLNHLPLLHQLYTEIRIVLWALLPSTHIIAQSKAGGADPRNQQPVG